MHKQTFRRCRYLVSEIDIEEKKINSWDSTSGQVTYDDVFWNSLRLSFI